MDFERSVFINCPFDKDYQLLLRPMIFTLIFMGFNPRLSSERSDCSEDRLGKIFGLITSSKFSIHDISYMQATKKNEVFRMNMPFELGIDYGVKKIGGKKELKSKQMLVLERKRYKYKVALSDISGTDIFSHNNDSKKLIKIIRDWFVGLDTGDFDGNYSEIYENYVFFSEYVWDRMGKKGKRGLDCNKMPIPEYIKFAKQWVKSRETSE